MESFFIYLQKSPYNMMLFGGAIASGALLLWPMLMRPFRAGSEVTAFAAVQLINREKGVLIDVSEPAEYAAGHAGGSKNLPFGSLETSNDLPRNKSLPLLLMCPTGARAQRAVAILSKRGHERVHSVTGGLAAWRAAGAPLETGAVEPVPGDFTCAVPRTAAAIPATR